MSPNLSIITTLFCIFILSCKKENKGGNITQNDVAQCNYFPYTTGSEYIYHNGIENKKITIGEDTSFIVSNSYGSNAFQYDGYKVFNIEVGDTVYKEYYSCKDSSVNQIVLNKRAYYYDINFLSYDILYTNKEIGYKWTRDLLNVVGIVKLKEIEIVDKIASYEVNGTMYNDVIKTRVINYSTFYDPEDPSFYYNANYDTTYNYYSKNVGLIETSDGNWKLISYNTP